MIKVLYAGSPEASATTLKILLEKNNPAYTIAGVLTNPPSAKGRKKDLIPTPVGLLAQEKNIPVYAPQKLDANFREVIAAQDFDLLLSFAYGHIFGPKFLSLFKMGGVNVHPSLLPKYRGATPIPACILNRDKETAVTVQTLALDMDEGDILAQQKIKLDFTETTNSLLDNAAKIGAELLDTLLTQTASLGKLPQGTPQQGEASYTKIIGRDDALINWNDSAEKICAHIRAYTSEPGAFTRIGSAEGDTLKILKAVPMCHSEPVEESLKKAPSTSLGVTAPPLSVTVGETLSCNGNAPLPAQVQESLTCNANAPAPSMPVSSTNQSAASTPASLPNAPAGTVLSFSKKDGILIKCGEGVLCVTELQRQQRKAMNYKDFMNGERNFVGTLLC